MVNSVNTNQSALLALQSLNNTASSLTTTQRRVTTGFKVADAFDEGAAFAVAQSVRQSSLALGSTNQGLASAKGVVDTATAATTKVSESLQSIRQVVTQLSDGGLADTKRAELQTQYKTLVAEIGKTIDDASSNGVNALGAEKMKVAINASGGSLEMGGYDLKAKLALPSEMNTAAAAQAFVGQTVPVNATPTTSVSGPNPESGVKLADLERMVGSVMSDLGASSQRISAQVQFNSAMQEALNTSAGALVDADLARESANLQALQVKQQLGVQTLGIANQAPQALLSLFR